MATLFKLQISTIKHNLYVRLGHVDTNLTTVETALWSARPVVIKSDFSEEGERSEPSELYLISTHRRRRLLGHSRRREHL